MYSKTDVPKKSKQLIIWNEGSSWLAACACLTDSFLKGLPKLIAFGHWNLFVSWLETSVEI